MISTVFTATLVGLVPVVAGHGYITAPTPRLPGDAMAKACGQQMFNNQKADNYGNIQGELQVANGQSDFDAAACHVWQCKGYQFEDNTANVQKFTAGQTVPITVDIRAPHTGSANVSIVKTSSNSVIGQPLISWDVYASNAVPIPADQENFSITIPTDLGSDCSSPGACVIQWFWDAPSIDQTYEACIDFTVGGSGDSAPSPSQAPPSSPPAPTSASSNVPPSTPAPVATPAAASPAAANPGASSSGESDGALPKTFTLDTFIAWLQKTAGSQSSPKTKRFHPRQMKM